MADYELYYWSVPFRGQFVRAVLAFAGASWSEGGDAAIQGFLGGPVGEMPVPFMGPPALVDRKAGVAVAQMPAVVLYLGETLGLLPADPGLRALTLKVVMDANDLIDDLTLDGGREMWTGGSWRSFVPRLRRWMQLWEDTGHRHGLTPVSGSILGGETPGIADVVTATLWTTLIDRFPEIGALLDAAAPMTAALARRVSGTPALADLAARSRDLYGEAYCGGRIEASLRAALEGWDGGG